MMTRIPLWARVVVVGLMAASAQACQDDGKNGTAPIDPGNPMDGEPDPGPEGQPDPEPDGIDPPIEEGCVSNADFFLREVWTPVIQRQCFNCHNPLGAAAESDMVYQGSGQVGFLDHNLSVFKEISSFERDGISVVLLKPTGAVSHGGGVQLEEDSAAYQALAKMVERAKNPIICPEEQVDETFFDGLVLATPLETLRKATLNLAGRLPTDAERTLVEEGGLQAVEVILDRLTREEVFYDRLRELFNDKLLTDRYLGGNRASDLLNLDYYPEARFYRDGYHDPNAEDPDYLAVARVETNNSIAREPLKLIEYILRAERPFTELLTADYMVVNPLTARVYGAGDVAFEDPNDPNEWQPARLPGLPHAGVLTSPMFLNRFPTTETNRNRHRSRMVYELFLATDVLKLGERPIDPTSTVHNPTLNDSQCAGCHNVVDPIAGAFQNWDTQGNYNPPETWYENMLQPGFASEIIPGESRLESLRWLAERISKDPRFFRSIVHAVHEGLTGQDILTLPIDPDAEGYAVALEAYETQQAFFDKVAREFEANDADLRGVIKAIIRSPFFRAANATEMLPELQQARLEALGFGRLLTPEMLNRKLEATMGFPWRNRVTEPDSLLREDYYLMLYGGIDSNDITERITAPNGIMANVQLRMANEMSCRFAALDFTRPSEQRSLFPFVEISYLPEDINGFEVLGAKEAIVRNIQYLHYRFLGEELALDDPEIERTWQLFYGAWKDGMAALENGEISTGMQSACQARFDYWTGAPLAADLRYDTQYTIRAWRAVLTYLMLDYRFLYE